MFFLRCCTFYIRIMNDSDANLCRSKPIMIRSFAHVCIKTTLLTSYHSKFSNIKIFSKVKKGDVNCGTWWWIYVQKINFISNAISIVNHLWCKSNPIIPIFICYYQPFLWWWCKMIKEKATLDKLGFFFYYNQNVYKKYSII